MSKLNIKSLLKGKTKTEVKDKTKNEADSNPALDKLNKILDSVRPALERDGGNLELVNFDEQNGIVKINFQGACAHCPIADVTLKHLIEAEIKSNMPEIKEVISI